MIKDLDRIQAAAKEDGLQSTSDENRQFMFFLTILRNHAKQVKRALVDNAEAMAVLHQASRDNLAKRNTERVKLDKAAASIKIANVVHKGANVFVALTGLFNFAESMGYITANPALVLAGRLGAIASMGASAASRSVRTKFENERIKHEGVIDTLNNANSKNDTEVQNYNQDMKFDHQRMSTPDTHIADLVKSLQKLQQSVLECR